MFQSNVAETCKHELMLRLPINKNYTLSFVNRTQTLSPQGIFFLPEVPRKGIIWGGIDCWKSLRNPKNPEVEKGLKKLCNRSDARKNTSMPLVHLSQGDSLSKKKREEGEGKDCAGLCDTGGTLVGGINLATYNYMASGGPVIVGGEVYGGTGVQL